MSLQLVKQEDGSYKVSAEVTVPQVVEHVFASLDEAVEKLKELEGGAGPVESEAPGEPVATEA